MAVSEVASSLSTEAEVRIGVSSCLLGHRVRYDGANKRDSNVTDVLGGIFRLVPICPEVEAGMPVPREPLRLLRAYDGRIRLVGRDSGSDRTAMLEHFARRRVRELEKLALSGYIFKVGSPSCGMHNVPVYSDEGVASTPGRGLFADVLLGLMPSLPVEEDDRLNDPAQRETFIARVRAYHRAHSRTYHRVRLNNHD